MPRYKLKAETLPTDPDYEAGIKWHIQIITPTQLSRLAVRMSGGGLNSDQVAQAMVIRSDLERGEPVFYQGRKWYVEPLPDLK